ncbi:MAG: sigma-54 dependent transcriptional regulator [Thermodesulfobacteriota bacterium]
MSRVLVIDDDLLIGEMIADIAADMGHACDIAGTVGKGLALVRSGGYDVVFLDVYLPDGSGLDALAELVALSKAPEVVVITGAGDDAVAERAIRGGAWDFVQKPLTLKSVTAPLERALSYRREKGAGLPPEAVKRTGIAGDGPAVRALLGQIALAAESGAAVLVSGETGTGKELVARAIHANSPRAAGPFVVVDCASLPETLVESILFGHVRGAFTGADKDREGLVALADGGTLFLDEVGELPFAMQKAFLRVLEERVFRPVGAKAERESDFRLVAATNRDLEAMARGGQFREDLLFRLRSLHIALPPLRERAEDVAGIVRLHLARMARRDRLPEKDFSPELLDALAAYPWPGNVRELVQALEMALAAARRDPTLYLKHLPEPVRVHYARALVRRESGGPAGPAPPPAGEGPADGAGEWTPTPWSVFRQEALDAAERDYFRRLLQAAEGDVRRACALAGVSRARLYQVLQKHGIGRS